jgi:carbonic anhydrase
MHTKQNNSLKILRNFLAMLLIIFLAVSLFSACGSADANDKKAKAKKLKAKREQEIEDESETNQENESEKTEEKPADANKENEKPKNEVKENLTGKKDDKKTDKSDKTETSKTSEQDKKAIGEAIWADLMKGNKRFLSGKHTTVNYSVSRAQLVKSQEPQVIVLGCSDSRVPPEIVFDKNLGELFVVRDAGNIADEVSLGSIEYAVEHLHSKVLLVLGHESCSAVAATLSGEEIPSKNLRAVVESIAPAFEGSAECKTGSKISLACVELNVNQSSKEVLLKSPIIKKAVNSGELTIVRAVYHLGTGEVIRISE